MDAFLQNKFCILIAIEIFSRLIYSHAAKISNGQGIQISSYLSIHGVFVVLQLFLYQWMQESWYNFSVSLEFFSIPCISCSENIRLKHAYSARTELSEKRENLYLWCLFLAHDPKQKWYGNSDVDSGWNRYLIILFTFRYCMSLELAGFGRLIAVSNF